MGVIWRDSVTPMSPRDKLLDDFRLHLTHERALCETTSKTYLSYVHKFLKEKYSGVTIDFSRLRAQDVTGFIRLHAQDCSHSYAKGLTKSLRSFLRYLHFRGDLTSDLAACVPAVAGWSLSDIPKLLEPHQIEQVLDHCNLRAATGLRDHAILLLLARLGLRACEVASLKIVDILCPLMWVEQLPFTSREAAPCAPAGTSLCVPRRRVGNSLEQVQSA
jgi:integrase/recombinase XerD